MDDKGIVTRGRAAARASRDSSENQAGPSQPAEPSKSGDSVPSDARKDLERLLKPPRGERRVRTEQDPSPRPSQATGGNGTATGRTLDGLNRRQGPGTQQTLAADLLEAKQGLNEEHKLDVQLPEKYYGKNQKELQEFLRSCNTLFRAKPQTYSTDEKKMRIAESFLKGDLAMDWERVNGEATRPNELRHRRKWSISFQIS